MNGAVVSVIIPVYNREHTIAKAIDSVLNQTYKNIEIIVVNDGSVDNTEIVIQKNYIDKVIYIKNKVNKGVSFSRNRGIRNAHGEYIAFLDSDDVWMEFHIEDSLKALESTGRFVCCSLWTENYYGNAFNLCESPYFKKTHRDLLKNELGISVDDELWVFPEKVYEYILKTDFYFYQINTLVIRNEIIEKIGYFDETMCASEDMDFCYRIFRKYPPVTINKSHFIYNYGHDNLWAFADREKDFKDFSETEKKKMKFTTTFKISFYKKLLERVSSDKALSDIQKIKENICFNIIKRYMTMNYLYNCKENTEEIEKYLINDRLKKFASNKNIPVNDFLILD